METGSSRLVLAILGMTAVWQYGSTSVPLTVSGFILSLATTGGNVAIMCAAA